MRPDTTTPADRWNVFLLTCRRQEIDFRFPLARELAALGHDVYYTYLKRRPVVTHLSHPSPEPREYTLAALASLMRRHLRSAPRGLVVNSTNLAFPGLGSGLRLFAGGLWCLDLHDDLLYEHRGWQRIKAKLDQFVIFRNTDLAVHAAPTLREILPVSHHLGNASDVTLLSRGAFQTDRVLVLASLDGRFDFDFLAEASERCADVTFHVYGQVSRGNAQVRGRIEALSKERANVVYHGAYNNAELHTILSKFSVTLAPYVTSSRLTHYIDPLRYYHCLNSGMEVISTDIPAARTLQAFLHIVPSADRFAAVLARLQQKPDARLNTVSTADRFNWRLKAGRIVDIVTCHAEDRPVHDA